MTDHKIGTRGEWLAAREQLLVREKEHTRLGDELAQQRRETLGMERLRDERVKHLGDHADTGGAASGGKVDRLAKLCWAFGRSRSTGGDRIHGRAHGEFRVGFYDHGRDFHSWRGELGVRAGTR